MSGEPRCEALNLNLHPSARFSTLRSKRTLERFCIWIVPLSPGCKRQHLVYSRLWRDGDACKDNSTLTYRPPEFLVSQTTSSFRPGAREIASEARTLLRLRSRMHR